VPQFVGRQSGQRGAFGGGVPEAGPEVGVAQDATFRCGNTRSQVLCRLVDGQFVGEETRDGHRAPLVVLFKINICWQDPLGTSGGMLSRPPFNADVLSHAQAALLRCVDQHFPDG